MTRKILAFAALITALTVILGAAWGFSGKIASALGVAWAENLAATDQKVEKLTDRQVKGFMDLYDLKLWKYLQTFPATSDQIQLQRQEQILNEVRREQRIYETEYIKRKAR